METLRMLKYTRPLRINPFTPLRRATPDKKMSAHFIPFDYYPDEDSAYLNFFYGQEAWLRLAEYTKEDEDLHNSLCCLKGWVHPVSIKEFAEYIRNVDVESIEPPLRYSIARLKEVILTCAEKGRGILHFH